MRQNQRRDIYFRAYMAHVKGAFIGALSFSNYVNMSLTCDRRVAATLAGAVDYVVIRILKSDHLIIQSPRLPKPRRGPSERNAIRRGVPAGYPCSRAAHQVREETLELQQQSCRAHGLGLIHINIRVA